MAAHNDLLQDYNPNGHRMTENPSDTDESEDEEGIELFYQQFPKGLARKVARQYMAAKSLGDDFDTYAAIENIIPGIWNGRTDRSVLQPSSPEDIVVVTINSIVELADRVQQEDLMPLLDFQPDEEDDYPDLESESEPIIPLSSNATLNYPHSSCSSQLPAGTQNAENAIENASAASNSMMQAMKVFRRRRNGHGNGRPIAIPTSPRRSLDRERGAPAPIFLQHNGSNHSQPPVPATDLSRYSLESAWAEQQASVTSSPRKRRRAPSVGELSTISSTGATMSSHKSNIPQPLIRPASSGSDPPQSFGQTNILPGSRRLLSLLASRDDISHNITQQLSGLDQWSLLQSLGRSRPDITASKNLKPLGWLPPKVNIGSSHLFWLSEAYPKRFSKEKRVKLNSIFRSSVPSVPTAVCAKTGERPPVFYYVTSPNVTRPAPPDLSLGPGRRGWPAHELPVEVFELVTNYLPRESVQAMRLVNTEFEAKTSNRLFHTVVVPFRSEIYGFFSQRQEPERTTRVLRSRKGKGKTKESSSFPSRPDKIVHDGMKVFEAWGRKIKRFAMAFEVDEGALETAPTKGKYEWHTTYWGHYKWPHPYYNRYDCIENLEKKADEFKCMTQALSYLHEVKELGLSLDDGLGWLSGPDKSDREVLLHQKPEVFGRTTTVSDVKHSENEKIWSELAESFRSLASLEYFEEFQSRRSRFIEAQVCLMENGKSLRLLNEENGAGYHPLIFDGRDIQSSSTNLDLPELIAERMVSEKLAGHAKTVGSRFSQSPLKPSELNVPQQEWLLETEWAQRAFLSSFCMALCDNYQAFSNVHTLNISKLSSRYLGMLQRNDIWDALPTINILTIKVSPDWRDIKKTDTGLVKAPSINPSKAATQFFDLLSTQISSLPNIKTLTIGYVGGGEKASGIFTRNKFLIPGPFLSYDEKSILDSPPAALKMPYVESLTLENMWLAPSLLTTFLLPSRPHHGRTLSPTPSNLRHLHLYSVSLTADTTNVAASAMRVPTFSDIDGRYSTAQGPPRYHDPLCAPLFNTSISCSAHYRGLSSPPDPHGWITTGVRIGSWPDVLDAITPGPTMEFLRYAYAYRDEPPALNTTNLATITLSSCGYVRLPNFKDFVQDAVFSAPPQLLAGGVIDLSNDGIPSLPSYFHKRAAELNQFMMHSKDELHGTIVTKLADAETDALGSITLPPASGGLPVPAQAAGGPAFPMTVGRASWGDETDRAWECLEDGQPYGGEGRISGRLERMVLPLLEEEVKFVPLGW